MTRRNFGLRPKTPAQHIVERNADLTIPSWLAFFVQIVGTVLSSIGSSAVPVSQLSNASHGSSFASPYRYGQSVKIDNGDIYGIVIGFCFYEHGHQVQVSWFNNGAVVEHWFSASRISGVT